MIFVPFHLYTITILKWPWKDYTSKNIEKHHHDIHTKCPLCSNQLLVLELTAKWFSKEKEFSNLLILFKQKKKKKRLKWPSKKISKLSTLELVMLFSKDAVPGSTWQGHQIEEVINKRKNVVTNHINILGNRRYNKLVYNFNSHREACKTLNSCLLRLLNSNYLSCVIPCCLVFSSHHWAEPRCGPVLNDTQLFLMELSVCPL